MLTALREWWSGSAVPTAGEMEGLLGKIGRLRKRFPDVAKATPRDAPWLELVDDELKDVKAKGGVDADKVDPDKWNALAEGDRRELASRADQLFDELQCLTRPELRAGRIYFVIFVALFALVGATYVCAHRRQWETRPPSKETVAADKRDATRAARKDGVTTHTIVEVVTSLKLVELEASTQRAKKPAKDLTDAERHTAIAAIAQRVDDLKETIRGMDLSFNSLQLLGTVNAEAQTGALLDSGDSVAKLRPALLADLESLRSGFFWSDRIWRWVEIAWWAEIGVLVGILFYLAGILGQGRFESEDVAMMWTEVAIAPAVVLAIFFLFTLTGITGISPSETALPGNIGFAFIFGFAIRRTLGLLDMIKKRIFPDPSP